MEKTCGVLKIYIYNTKNLQRYTQASFANPLANNLIRCNPFPVLEASFNDKKCPIGALFPTDRGEIW